MQNLGVSVFSTKVLTLSLPLETGPPFDMVIRAGEGLAVSTFISHGYFKNLSILPASVID